MPSFALPLIVLATLPLAPEEPLPMPPPPAGMRVLGPEDKRLLLGSAAAVVDPAEDGEADEQVESESAELEELRALEEVSLDPAARPDAAVLQAVRRLGLANPLRQRMLDALEEPTLREEPAFTELPLVTDLDSLDISRLRDRYDIPLDMQPLVAQYIQFFQGPGRRWFRKWMSRSSRYIPVMQPILEERGLPRDTVYLAMIESGFSTSAYSWAHAAGPWQFIASTGKMYGLRQDFWVDERRDPLKSTRAAAAYLKDLHKELGHWYLAWAGYNTGGGRVRRMISRLGTEDFWVLSAGRGLAKETKHYVPKLIACAIVAKNPKAFGFSEDEFDFEEPLTFDEVQLNDATDLDVVARAAGVPVKAIRELNPELKRWCTPPASPQRPYTLRLPAGAGARFAENFARIPAHERLTFRVHRVKRGDTLSQIARAYGSAVEAILHVNRLRSVRSLRINSDLIIPVPSGRGRPAREGTVLARKVAQARRSGVVAVRPEEEIPAGTPSAPIASGPVRSEVVDGRVRVAYTVQSGDSLWAIGQRFGVSVDDLRRWNRLSSRRRGLHVGKVLHVWPASGTQQVEERGGTVIAHREPEAGATRPTVHPLAAGETLWSVSQRYKVSVEELKRWNNIKDHRSVRAGQLLTVTAP